MSITSIADDDVAAAVAVLVGQPFVPGARAVDMEMFEFGVPRPRTDRKGRTRISGDYALHVQAPWRIVAGQKIVVGYFDHWEPPNGVDPEAFDSREAKRTLRDDLLDAYHAERADPLRTVAAVQADATGDLTIVMDDGSRLEIRPSGTTVEYWRLLRPDGSHVVLEHDGPTLAAP